MLDWALNYAAAAWPVFPLQGKLPLTRHGFKSASTDEQQIWDWWRRWPTANIGLAIPPGVLILDVDPRHNGSTNLAELTNLHSPIPETRVCITGRQDGGCHFYLTAPAGRLTDRRLPEGIDIRVGGKHYVVAPPSIHPDTGKPYVWNEIDVMAPCPRWLADLIRVPIAPAAPPPQHGQNTPTRGLVNFVADLQEGNRNHGFFWACCTAISDGIYPTIREDLKTAARSIGLTDHEIEATAASAERRADH